jgi:hypothetical protein
MPGLADLFDKSLFSGEGYQQQNHSLIDNLKMMDQCSIQIPSDTLLSAISSLSKPPAVVTHQDCGDLNHL